jgi:hypothetical protein
MLPRALLVVRALEGGSFLAPYPLLSDSWLCLPNMTLKNGITISNDDAKAQ